MNKEEYTNKLKTMILEKVERLLESEFRCDVKDYAEILEKCATIVDLFDCGW